MSNKEDNITKVIEDGNVCYVSKCHGSVFYYKDENRSKFHRDSGGPAVKWKSGEKWWYKNGKRHRIDGPAIEYVNGYKEYFLNNIKYEEKEYWAMIRLGSFV